MELAIQFTRVVTILINVLSFNSVSTILAPIKDVYYITVVCKPVS